MGFTEAKELFKQGQLKEALQEINQETKKSNDVKLLKSLILYYQGQFKDSLLLADQILTETSSPVELIDELKARIVKSLSLVVALQWTEAFTEVNNAENLVEKLSPQSLESEKAWIAELYLSKGLLTEILFGETELAVNIEHQAYDLFMEVEDYCGAAWVLNTISMIYFFDGFLEESKKVAEQALTFSETKGIKIGIVYSLYRIGDCYFSIGNLEAAFKAVQKGIKIASDIENKWFEGELRLILGKVYYRQGEFKQSQLELKRSIQLAEEVGDQHLIAKSTLNLGDILQIEGDVHGAIEKFHQSFRIFRGLKDSNCSIDTNLKLGKAYMILGELQLAYQQFYNSFIHRLWNRDDNLPTNEIPPHAYAYPETLFQLILVTLELELLDQSKLYLQRLEKFYIREPNSLIHYQTRLASSMILKRSTRITKKIQAQKILKKLVNEKIVDHGLTVIAILNYCDMLVAELKFSGEAEVLEELETLFQKLIELSRNKNAPSLEIDALLLSSKVSLVEGEIKKAHTFLHRAQITAEKKGLSYLLPKIIRQRESLNNGSAQDFVFTDENTPLKDRLEGVQLQNYIIDTLKSSFIQDLSRQFFPISRMGLGNKYQLVYRDFLKEQLGDQKSKCRVAIAQIGIATQSDLLSEFYEEIHPSLFGLKKDKVSVIASKVKKMIEEAHVKEVNVLLFPELSIDLNYSQLLDEISGYAKQFQMYIIPGSFHEKDTKRNISVAVTPHGILWEQEKHIPATITYKSKRFTDVPRETIIADTEYGRMAIVICRDFLDMDLRVELKNFEPPIDLIFNLSFTPVTADFKAAHFDARRSIYSYCFFTNIGEFGDSSIYTPEKERIERTIPPGEEGLIYKDVDLFQLRSERKKWEKEGKYEKKFIQSTR
ncbi:MAG: nitrilase-related carbon-nitrogen hydrolase [Candidatus Hodarchaeales archaeon]|jgi:tetratricopeptide (TPR) repeat protein/predicted amidohydrolase